MTRSLALSILGALAAAALLLGCEASLETTCVTGDNCAEYQPTPGIVEMKAGCLETCDATAVSGNTGEYPCAVDKVVDVCRACHVENGSAPFSLDTYEDSQQLYANEAIWSRMVPAVTSDFMPLTAMKLSDEQKNTLLDEWACVCGPPRDAEEVCP